MSYADSYHEYRKYDLILFKYNKICFCLSTKSWKNIEKDSISIFTGQIKNYKFTFINGGLIFSAHDLREIEKL